MKCPCCGIEMLRKTAAQWVCRNPKCIKYNKEKKKEKYSEKEKKILDEAFMLEKKQLIETLEEMERTSDE